MTQATVRLFLALTLLLAIQDLKRGNVPGLDTGEADWIGLSPDGKTLYALSRKLEVTRIPDWEWKAKGQGGGGPRTGVISRDEMFSSGAVSPDDKTFAVGTADGAIRFYAIASFDLSERNRVAPVKRVVGHEGEITGLVFSPDGKSIATSSRDKTVKVWDAAKGTVTRTLSDHTDAVMAVAWSKDGKRLVSASSDGTAIVWDPTTGKKQKALAGHERGLTAVAIAKDSTTVATASDDGSVRMWSAATGKELRKAEEGLAASPSLAFSPDGTRLAGAGSDKTVRVWDVVSGTIKHTLKPGDGGPLVAFSADGTRLFVSGANQVSFVELPAK